MPKGKEGYEIRHRHHRRDYGETRDRNKCDGVSRRVWEIVQGYNNIITYENNKKRRIEAILQPRKQSGRKAAVTLQENKCKRLKKENDLLRKFLDPAGRN